MDIQQIKQNIKFLAQQSKNLNCQTPKRFGQLGSARDNYKETQEQEEENISVEQINKTMQRVFSNQNIDLSSQQVMELQKQNELLRKFNSNLLKQIDDQKASNSYLQKRQNVLEMEVSLLLEILALNEQLKEKGLNPCEFSFQQDETREEDCSQEQISSDLKSIQAEVVYNSLQKISNENVKYRIDNLISPRHQFNRIESNTTIRSKFPYQMTERENYSEINIMHQFFDLVHKLDSLSIISKLEIKGAYLMFQVYKLMAIKIRLKEVQ